MWVHLFVQVRQKALECAQRRKRCMQMEKRTAEMTTNAEEQIQNYELKCGLVKGVGSISWPTQGSFPLEGVLKNRTLKITQTFEKETSFSKLPFSGFTC